MRDGCFTCELCGKLIDEEEYRRNDSECRKYMHLCYACEESIRKEEKEN